VCEASGASRGAVLQARTSEPSTEPPAACSGWMMRPGRAGRLKCSRYVPYTVPDGTYLLRSRNAQRSEINPAASKNRRSANSNSLDRCYNPLRGRHRRNKQPQVTGNAWHAAAAGAERSADVAFAVGRWNRGCWLLVGSGAHA